MTPAEGQGLVDAVGAMRFWRAEQHQDAFDLLGIGAGADEGVDVVLNIRALFALASYAIDTMDGNAGEFLDALLFAGQNNPRLSENA